MKKFLRVIGWMVLIALVIHFTAVITGYDYLLKALRATYLHGTSSASIDDAQFFDTHTIAAGEQHDDWVLHSQYNQKPLTADLRDMLIKTKSVAFLVVQNDSLITEHYWDGYSDTSQSNSFSMAKSITTMLAQIAIQKGTFTGWNQKVMTIQPELKGAHADKLELWHLSTMSSGLEWDEQYQDPFAVTAKSYYGKNVSELMMNLHIVNPPGKVYNYQSGSTQLLALCLIRKTGKPLAELASEWLWKPIHASRDARWHTDERGTELAFCCFNSNARDFARFGKLMLHKGNWNGVQILDSSFVALATQGTLVPYYGYSFWIDDSHGTPVFYQRGILGQYIITIPAYNLVIVRLGHYRAPNEDNAHSPNFHTIVEDVLKMVKG